MCETAMAPPPLVRRVEILEEQVSALNQLPERVAAVETQLVAVRVDLNSLRVDMATMRDELLSCIDSGDRALRDEMRAGDEQTRREMHALHAEVLSRIETVDLALRAGDEETRREMHALHQEVLSRIEAVRASDEETRSHMRVLHEEVISRIALLQEGLNWKNGPSGRPAHTRKPRKRRR